MRKGQRRIVMLVLAAVLLGGMVWAPAALAAGEANVIGQVQGTGYKFTVPLSGANTEIMNNAVAPPAPTGFVGVTDFNGWYSIATDASLPLYYGANLVVAATATNYVDGMSAGFSISPGDVKVVNIRLTVKATTFTGVVKRGSRGLKGVKVAVAGKSVKTNAKGKWTISGLLLKPGAKYKVTYTKRGYKKVVKRYMSLPGATRNVGTVKMRKR